MSEHNRDPALLLLDDLDPKVDLSSQAKQRIVARLGALAPQPVAHWPWVVAACAATIAIVASAVFIRKPSAPQATAQELRVGSCATTRFDAEGRYAAILVGPAAARVDASWALMLRSGRAIVQANDHAMVVDVAKSRVSIAPSSLVELEVHEVGSPRIAVYAGHATIGSTTLQAGQLWASQKLEATDAQAAGRARELLSGSASATDALCTLSMGTQSTDAAPASASPAVVATAPSRRAVSAPSHAREPTADVTTPSTAEVVVAPLEDSPTEAERIAEAIELLRVRRDPRSALAILEPLAATKSTFGAEIDLLRLEAFEQLGDGAHALGVLDALDLSAAPRRDELHVLRGDLRASGGRYEEAIEDYSASTGSRSPTLVERALFGRASCRLRVGQDADGRKDLRAYLERFPHGRFADAAKIALGGKP